jgi:hypothetical protein
MSSKNSTDKLDRVVSQARIAREEREKSYRSRALKMYPWFNEKNLQELTVHHRDHDHDNNPDDGSNWELLCVYCHDNEHSRFVDSAYGDATTEAQNGEATYNPFAELASMLNKKK